jgi:hypothetical protein
MIITFSILVTVLACLSTAAGQVIRAEAGLVKKVNGEVLVHCHNRQPDATELTTGAVLHNDDLVITTRTGSTIFSLNRDSYLQMSADTIVRVKETALSSMHFDVDAGEIIVLVGGLKNGASLVLHAPPGILELRKKGLYRVSVNRDGSTQVNVVRGELVYTDHNNRRVRAGKGKQVDFRKRNANSVHSK